MHVNPKILLGGMALFGAVIFIISVQSFLNVFEVGSEESERFSQLEQAAAQIRAGDARDAAQTLDELAQAFLTEKDRVGALQAYTLRAEADAALYPDRSIDTIFQPLLTLLERAQDSESQSILYRSIGNAHAQRQDWDNAFVWWSKAATTAAGNVDGLGSGQILQAAAVRLADNGRADLAERAYKGAILAFTVARNAERLATCYHQLADLQASRDFDRALENYYNAVFAYQQAGMESKATEIITMLEQRDAEQSSPSRR